jgi:hypothetical protein
MPFELRQKLLSTDRGDLWLASRDREPRLVRLLDRRRATSEFRRALDELAERIAKARPPRVLRILCHESVGDHYYVEYGLDWSVETLRAYFSGAPWLRRLGFVHDTLQRYESWREVVSLPLGLHAGRVVACQVNALWVAHLAPCPTVALSSPSDLTSAEPDVLAAIAPERLRNRVLTGALEDVFAAGTMVLQALGVRPASDLEATDRIEAQARRALQPHSLAHAQIEGALRQVPAANRRLQNLEQVARRCVDFSPEARPPDLRELLAACEEVLTIEATERFAAELEAERPADALRFLEWAIEVGDDRPATRRLSADLCRRLELPARELQHLERLALLEPGSRASERRRMELRYDAYMLNSSAIAPGNDPESDWLLAALERLRMPNDARLDDERIREAKDDRLRAAMIYGRRGDRYRRVVELAERSKIEFADIEGLFLYGLALRELALEATATPEYRATIARTLDELEGKARSRLRALVQAEHGAVPNDEQMDAWTERFASLKQF